MECRAFCLPLSTRDVTEAGEFEGYLAVFNEPYQVGWWTEVVKKGAFKDTIKSHNGRFPLLWQHDHSEVIGHLIAKEDRYGLHIRGKLNLEVQQARETLALLREGDVSGLSMGFIPVDAKEHEGKDGELEKVELRKVNLWEGSVVTFPAQPLALVEQVRARQANIQESAVRASVPVAVVVRARPVPFILGDQNQKPEGRSKQEEPEEEPEEPEERDLATDAATNHHQLLKEIDTLITKRLAEHKPEINLESLVTQLREAQAQTPGEPPEETPDEQDPKSDDEGPDGNPPSQQTDETEVEAVIRRTKEAFSIALN